LSTVAPLRAILFQLLFLAIAIAIEAFVLQKKLKVSRKTSVQYATSMNLLSTIVGWLLFFNLEPLLPSPYKAQLISYMLFNQFFVANTAQTMSTFLTLGMMLAFVGTFVMERKGLDLLEFLLEINPTKEKDYQKIYQYRDRQQRQEATLVDRNRAITILIANTCSYAVILVIFFSHYLISKT
jgi:hypothetical protein